ncbi:MAG: type II toxin-antitoxin system RatA family toxin [Legionellales bacterium]|jgi:ribosome-associated toxin RatA of RatAB toxin-antitoxin module|nr:type II toxin-antitoxin system RatA family toxin [Legionellales bacterium]
MKTVYKEKIIPYLASDMYSLVANISSYPDFVPYCHSTIIEKDSEKEVVASIELNFHGIIKKFTTTNAMVPSETISMKLKGGPLESLNGKWVFKQLSATSSKITLHIEYEVSNNIYAAVADTVIAKVSNDILMAFVSRAGQVYG